MPNSESDPQWILPEGQPKDDDELRAAASRLWPRVQAHVRHKLANKDPDESTLLATQVWEAVLRSVSKTLRRHSEIRSRIADLDAYLFGIFLHRFNRALKRERRREQTIALVASTGELEQLPGARDWKSARELERSLELQEAIENMDGWTREVFTARVYGYTWREIAKLYGLKENQAKLRFRQALLRLADRLRSRK